MRFGATKLLPETALGIPGGTIGALSVRLFKPRKRLIAVDGWLSRIGPGNDVRSPKPSGRAHRICSPATQNAK
jgi:hypothetical protein